MAHPQPAVRKRVSWLVICAGVLAATAAEAGQPESRVGDAKPLSHGTPPGVVPGDWPTYAPLGFGGYRFPAVGAQAYR